LTLDRPGKRNALNSDVCHELVEQLEAAQADGSIGAVLLDGQGPSFCAGMDLDEAVLPEASLRIAIHERLFTIGETLNKPLIAAVHGNTLGGGLGLVANAHVAIAADDSRFGLPEIKVGMWPFTIWPALKQAIGERRALELCLTGRILNFSQALDWGLVHYSVPAAQLQERALELAQQVANASPQAIEQGMRLTREAARMNSQSAVSLAAGLRAAILESEDFREGVRAFREKRIPRWQFRNTL
jgi:enoyl-CoA hydratase/carnithine racemase